MEQQALDRKSTRLNSSHLGISYAVFCLKKTNMARFGVYNRGSPVFCGRCCCRLRGALWSSNSETSSSMSQVLSTSVFHAFFFFKFWRPPRIFPFFPPPPLLR